MRLGILTHFWKFAGTHGIVSAMPRFGIKSLLIVITVVALWFSTFTDYPVAYHVRRSIVLLIFSASVLVAVYGRGRWRAFWIGFSLMLFLTGSPNLQLPLYNLASGSPQQVLMSPRGQNTRIS